MRQTGSTIGIAIFGLLIARDSGFVRGLHVEVVVGGASELRLGRWPSSSANPLPESPSCRPRRRVEDPGALRKPGSRESSVLRPLEIRATFRSRSATTSRRSRRGGSGFLLVEPASSCKIPTSHGLDGLDAHAD
jgi:hypothetical protein